MLLAACILCLPSMPAEAQWKWRDKTGRVQYSDIPPPFGVPESAILQRPQGTSRPAAPAFVAPSASAASSAAAPGDRPLKSVDPELEARRKKAEQDQAATRKLEDDKAAAARAENCTRAKSSLRAVQDGMRVVRINAQGEQEFLDDAARAEEAKRIQSVMASDCK